MTLRLAPSCSGIAFLFVTSVTVAQQALRTLEPSQMQEDLFLLSDTFERLHAGLHRYTEPEELDAAFSDALLAVEEPRDVVAFYRIVSEVVSHVRCGHTGVSLKPADRGDGESRKGLLPLEIHLQGERAWVRRNLDPALDLEPGTEILAIDGLSMAEIRARAFSRMRGDGFIETGKERELESDFASLFALLVDDVERFPAHYALAFAGREGAREVRGLAPDEFARLRSQHREEDIPVELQIRADDSVGILGVRFFGDPQPPEPAFPDALEKSFLKLRDDGVRGLIVDLRGNGGGRDQYGALLVSYLASKPFGYFEKIEVTPEYQGDVEIVERDERRLMMSHSGLALQQPSALAFRGKVVVLIDGGTSSTAADVATVAHCNRLATFVGEETGGGYLGNTSGDSQRLLLPHSGFTVGVPMWCYETANVGKDHAGRGVPPDVEVRPSIEDALSGRDAALEEALKLVRSE